MHQALRATSITLRELVNAGFAAEAELADLFDPTAGGTLRVTLGTPQEMREANLDGVSLWLYRIDRDEQLVNQSPTRPAPDRELRTRLPLRLHYLVTPVVGADVNDPDTAPERKQALLGRVLQVLFAHPIVRGADLADLLAGTDSEVTVRLEPLSMEEIARVWGALQRPYQLSVSYEATVAYVAPDVAPTAVAPVDDVAPHGSLIVGTGA